MYRILFLLCCFSIPAAVLEAGDWPQILGPDRNGIAQNETLPEKFLAGGPKSLWEVPAGEGFSGAAVVGNRAVLFYRQDNSEVVQAVDLQTGESLWKNEFSTDYNGQIIPDEGPRAVPVIVENQVFVYGAAGGMRSLELQTGNILWSQNLLTQFGAREGYFGAGSTPIVVDNLLIVNVGGFRENAGVVAFDRKTGNKVWNSISEHASYSSPVLTKINGKSHLLVTSRLSTFSLDPQTGAVNFSLPFGKRGPTVNAANPVLLGDKLFLTASYGIGEVFGTIKNDSLDIHWQEKHLLDSQYTTSIVYQNHLFGVDGRQDGGSPVFCCLDPFQPKLTWTKSDLGYATLIRAGDKLLHFNTEGELRLIQANTEKYEELDHAQLFTGTTRALPALSNGLFLARDEKGFKCFRLGE